MTLTFNQDTYRCLLFEMAPKIIESEDEYQQALTLAEKLTFQKNLTPEETAIYQLLVTLIEVYETQNFPMDSSTPQEIIRHLIEASGTRQADLVGIIGSSGVVSEVVNGKRAISKAQAKALGDYFNLDPSLFI
ncbi:MAG TPA: transcriptional regulator [Cyanothece sp. UBA12306]|nr:transcriptional regulator [Cyanothece sp. UBA12306]